MIQRLYLFWMHDEKERTKALAAATIMVLLYGLFFNVLLHRDLAEVSHEALIPALLVLVCWPIGKDVAVRIRRWSLSKCLLASVALVGFLLLVPIVISMYIKNQATSLAALPQREFQNNLSKAAKTLTAVSISGINVPQMHSIEQRLITTDSKVPNYWPTVSQFITYRSQVESAQSFAGTMPRCYDIPPAMQLMVGQSASVWTTPLEWTDCVLDLTEDIPQQWWDSISGSKLYKDRVVGADPNHILVLTNCLVRYNGGRIPEHVFTMLGFTYFRNCLFDFSFENAPPKNGERLSRMLLASASMKDIKLPSLLDQ